jgi:hypothetical protein
MPLSSSFVSIPFSNSVYSSDKWGQAQLKDIVGRVKMEAEGDSHYVSVQVYEGEQNSYLGNQWKRELYWKSRYILPGHVTG